MITYSYKLDMTPGGMPVIINLNQYDSDITLVFSLYTRTGTLTLQSGTTAMIRGTKRDGNAYDADATINVPGNYVEVAVDSQMTAAAGKNVFELVLYKDGKVLSTANFILMVEHAAMDADTITSDSVLKEMNALIESASTATAAAEEATEAAQSVSASAAQIETNRQAIATNASGIAANATAVADLKDDLDNSGLSWNIIPLDYYSGDDYTNYGIHFVKQSDGSVYSSGTATSQARYYWLYQAELPAGNYKIGGMPEGASGDSFRLQYSINDGAYVTISSTTDITINDGDTVNVRSWYKAGYVDEGHTWNVFIGTEGGNKNSKNNPKYFIPLIYQNTDDVANLEGAVEGNTSAIEDNTSAIDRINEFIKWDYFDAAFEIGSLSTGGGEAESTSRVRSGYIETEDCKLNVVEGYRFAVHYYATNSSNYSSDSDYWLNAEYTLKTEYPYFRYVVEKIPVATVQQSEIETYGNSVRIDRRTVLTKTIDSIDERVTEIEQIDVLPDYWESYLVTKIPQINNEIYSIGNHGIVFTFFTDYHYVQSEYNYQGFTWLPRILKRIKQQCPVENFIFGGDILTNNDTRAEAVTILEKFREDYKFLNLKNINGNHETNPYGGEPVTIDDIYSILFRGMGMEESVNLKPDLYWYYDNEPQKIRIIALNTGEGVFNSWKSDTNQHKWIVDTLAATPSGYTVIIMPHVFFGLSNSSLFVSSIGENIQSIVDAYATKASGVWNTTNYDFTNANGTVACILCGHTHNDGMIESQAGYPMIGIVCDAMWGSQQNVQRGTSARETTAEHAFDVVCIDTTAKTIKCVRVGSGTDRTYTY